SSSNEVSKIEENDTVPGECACQIIILLTHPTVLPILKPLNSIHPNDESSEKIVMTGDPSNFNKDDDNGREESSDDEQNNEPAVCSSDRHEPVPNQASILTWFC
ncbi:unnamed protein product, partial [Rotaria sordida]